jgi:hypothetical protein
MILIAISFPPRYLRTCIRHLPPVTIIMNNCYFDFFVLRPTSIPTACELAR